MKLSYSKPVSPIILTLSFETPEEARIFGEMSTYCLSIPSMMGLEPAQSMMLRNMLSQIADELVHNRS